jgi:hypothetical protein
MYERGNALWMLGVGKSLEQAIGGSQDREGHSWAIDERGQTLVMAFTRFAEQHRFNAAAGAKCFFNQANAFYADPAGLGGQAAAKGQAKFLEPAIVAARERGQGAGLASAASNLSWSSHDRERNKFSRPNGNPMER